jgi:16S rRNA (cytosine967-C5)-methyltransferase
MKIHRTLIEAIINALHQVFNQEQYADKVNERILKSNPKWGSRDRGFIAENTYEIVRWFRLVTFLADCPEQNLSKGDLWQIVGTWLVHKGMELPDWSEFRNINPRQIAYRLTLAKQDQAIIESIPAWLEQLGQEQLGELWPAEIASLNVPAPLVIRANTLKTSSAKLQTLLQQTEITALPIDGYPDALLLKKRSNLFSNPFFQQGLFEVQDASSQRVAAFLAPGQGMTVIDACAGAGGKTLHLSALMQNKGRIISMDTEAWKLEELKKRAKRAGAQNIETQVIAEETISKLYNKADRLLLDVPCSGLGVLRRNPDAKWKLKPEFIDNIRNTQQHIINEYSKMLKPGGLMVYATCSILPLENQYQVQQFLEDNTDFSKVGEQVILSHQSGFDGFYMALLKKE